MRGYKTDFDLEELAKILVKAKKATYAGDGAEVEQPQRPGFKELEFREGDWCYRDSYAGFFLAPGQEVVWYKDEPVWAMSYSGGMRPRYCKDIAFAKKTFAFLKKALLHVNTRSPFRGPKHFIEGDFEYKTIIEEGDITYFRGRERVYFNMNVVFEQQYVAGLIIPKEKKPS